MNFFINNINSVFSGLESSRILTTPSIVKDVMGVPMAAVRSIAHSAGLDIKDEDGTCIDENALSYFAEAYVRKMKAYYLNAKRKLPQLGPEEQLTFYQFCNQFKKPNYSSQKTLSWSDIDTDAIRRAFYEEVYRLSPKRSRQGLFSELIGFDIFEEKPTPVAETPSREFSSEKQQILYKVVRSYLYRQRTPHTYKARPACRMLQRCMIAAHFYMYPSDGTSDHLSTTVISVNGQYPDLLINRTTKMVA